MGKRLRKLKKIRLHHEGTATLILGFIVFAALNALVYYLAVPSCPMISYVFATITTVIYLCVVNFFRCPIRHYEDADTEGLIIAPADGKVVVIEKVFEPDHFKDERLQVSIFMSPMNVHANWYPIEGKVLVSEHQDGYHKGAWLPKSSTENERSLVVIETPSKVQIAVRQIAGAMARRIVTYAKAGGQSHRNEHFGFIKFGSRIDVLVPKNSELLVEIGDPVVGSQTPLVRLHK